MHFYRHKTLPSGLPWWSVVEPMHGKWVHCQVWEDLICHGATNPACHTTEIHVPRVHALQQKKPPMYQNKEYSPLITTRDSPHAAVKTQPSQKLKINSLKTFPIKCLSYTHPNVCPSHLEQLFTNLSFHCVLSLFITIHFKASFPPLKYLTANT